MSGEAASSAEASFLLAVCSGEVPEDAALDAARAAGLDPHGLGLRLRSQGLAVLAREGGGRLETAAEALRRAGVRCAVVAAAQARELPGARVAGGVASVPEGISLRVHGRPAGPPPGVPLLFVYGDVGRERAQRAAEPRPGDTFRQRLLRAVYPVTEVIWSGGRLRVALRGMAWRGLPGAGSSAPANFVLLLERLAAQSGRATLDLGFAGQDLAIEPLRGADEPLEGADRERLRLFERYAAAAAIAFTRGLYPEGSSAVPSLVGGLENRSATPLSPPAPAASKPSPVPWIRRSSGAPRREWKLRQVLPFTPLLLYAAARAWLGSSPGAQRGEILAAAVLAAVGLALALSGLAALSRRERFRAVPTSKVSSLAMGPAETAGRILPTASFTAPYSRTSCVWYRFEIEERSGTEEKQGVWRAVQRGSSGDVPFRLTDETGAVLVQPAGARVEVDPVVSSLGSNSRVREWILVEGSTVYVAGYAHRRSVEEGIAGTAERDDVFVGAGPDGFLVISPRPHGEQARHLGAQALLRLAGGLLGLLLAVALVAS